MCTWHFIVVVLLRLANGRRRCRCTHSRPCRPWPSRTKRALDDRQSPRPALFPARSWYALLERTGRIQPLFLDHELVSGLLLDAVCPPIRLLRRCRVSHCPSRHRPPAFPPDHTADQSRQVTHVERQSQQKGTVTYALTYHIRSNDFPLDLDVNTDSDEHAAYSTRPPQEHMKQDHLRSHTSTRFPKNTSLVDINMYLLQPATQC